VERSYYLVGVVGVESEPVMDEKEKE